MNSESGEGMRVPAGPSILETLWRKLDETMVQLMSYSNPGTLTPSPDQAKFRGMALARAEDIAVITNPYDPNLDAVRAEAAARYEARNI